MTTITTTVSAIHYGADQFMPEAFNTQIGKTLPVVDASSGLETRGVLAEAEVSADGTHATLTFEVLHHGESARGYKELNINAVLPALHLCPVCSRPVTSKTVGQRIENGPIEPPTYSPCGHSLIRHLQQQSPANKLLDDSATWDKVEEYFGPGSGARAVDAHLADRPTPAKRGIIAAIENARAAEQDEK